MIVNAGVVRKTSWMRLTALTYELVTDRQTDRQTHKSHIGQAYCTSVTGKKYENML